MEQKLGGSQLHQRYSHFLLSKRHEELTGKLSTGSDTYKLRARLAAISTSIKLPFTVSKCSASWKSEAPSSPSGGYLGSENNFIWHRRQLDVTMIRFSKFPEMDSPLDNITVMLGLLLCNMDV